ncbi:WD domain, G-beta repeat/Dip2/Utp12 Family [Novymonas esmeraldas]|uniref:WD domain, G-beta repeat/Dip2/Utp12 Family n=1 Tax=Novymonas esmeraldas TaxID=1808958 RepID=A0AAW0EWI8_9TRYP
MVEKTYLRYVVGPQGGAVVSSASLAMDTAVVPPRYTVGSSGRGRGGLRAGPSSPSSSYGRGGGRVGAAPAVAAAAAVVFVPSLEAVRVYSVRSGELLHTLIPAEAKMPVEVTTLQVVPVEGDGWGGSASTSAPAAQQYSGGWMLLVGYSNGYVAVFTCTAANNYGLPVCRLYALGHRVDTQVLAVAVAPSRATLCSGGQDTDVTVWDLVSQEASFRLRGHRGGVVALSILPSPSSAGGSGGGSGGGGGGARERTLLLSGSADGLVKTWDVALRHCLHTVIASDTQVTAMVADSQGRRLYCGLRENYLKVYNTESLLLSAVAAEKSGGGGGSRGDGASSSTVAVAAGAAEEGALVDHGTVARKHHKPITALSFSHDGAFIVGCTSRTVEVFHVLTAEDVRKKLLRKRKRRRGPATAADTAGRDAEVGRKSGKTKSKSKTADDDDDADGREEDDEAEEDGAENVTGGTAAATAAEEVVSLRAFFLSQKIRSVHFVPPTAREQLSEADTLHIAVTYNNNTMETFTTTLTTSDREGAAVLTLTDLKLRHSFDWKGHHSDIRELAFVDTDTALLSMSREKVMMWSLTVQSELLESDHLDNHDFYDAKEANVARVNFKGALNNVGSVDVEDATCMAAISSLVCCVGQQDGSVVLIDVASSVVLFREPAIHVGGVKHVVRKPDGAGFVSLGADRRLLLWAVGLTDAAAAAAAAAGPTAAGAGGGGATLVQEQEIELTEAPLCAAFSPDGRFFGVGMQNNNIQLFFADSMKPYLSLFGHKLPPTSLAFSTDGTLIASVGMDKSLRFWGTDFGDCHRAIHAHDDYITQVEFLEDTHYVFTVSMDGSVKQWDGDNWTMVQLFRQHQRGLWAVSTTANGTCVATAGADRCIRCLLRTQDIVFPQEEEERMAQEAMDEEAAKRAALQKLSGADANGGGAAEVGIAGQQTSATAEAAERLMEALDVVSVEQQRKQRGDDETARHPMLLNMSEWEYLWSIIETIRPSELRHTLLSLTSVHVDALLTALESMVSEKAVLNYETASKIVLALVMMPAESASTQGLRAAAIRGEVSEVRGARRLAVLRRCISEGLDESVSRMDYSVAGLHLVRQHLEDSEKIKFFDRSKAQGYKRKYHSRALPTAGDKH